MGSLRSAGQTPGEGVGFPRPGATARVMWVLWNKLCFSQRPVSALSCWTVSLVPGTRLLFTNKDVSNSDEPSNVKICYKFLVITLGILWEVSLLEKEPAASSGFLYNRIGRINYQSMWGANQKPGNIRMIRINFPGFQHLFLHFGIVSAVHTKKQGQRAYV